MLKWKATVTQTIENLIGGKCIVGWFCFSSKVYTCPSLFDHLVHDIHQIGKHSSLPVQYGSGAFLAKYSVETINV